MDYAETLERLRKLTEGPGGALTKPTKAPSVSSVSAPGGPFSDLRGEPGPAEQVDVIPESGPGRTDRTDRSPPDQEPEHPCPICGGPAYYQDGGSWRCTYCIPPRGPVAVMIAVPGGRAPDGDCQEVDEVLREAAAGVPVPDLRAALAPEDLEDIARGRMDRATVAAYARVLEQEPRP